jgi:DNA-binding transcriptional ArsR family regulator
MRTFSALADPTRAKIIQVLARRDLSAGEIAARFPVSRPAISRHLGVLRRARLVQIREDAQRRVYSLNPAGLYEIEKWVMQCRRMWNQRLDALGSHLDQMAARESKVERK